MSIVIDKEFSLMLPPLSAEERAQLEKSMLAEGCREPMVVWSHGGQDVLIDGHNRWDICETHKIPGKFQYLTDKQIPSRAAAVEWILANQLARRNLPEDVFAFYLGRLYNGQKASRGGDRKSNRQRDGLIGNVATTAEKLAKEHGVSTSTVERAGRFAEAVEKAKETDPDIERRVLRGEVGRKDVLGRAKSTKPAEPKLDPDGRPIPRHLHHTFEVADQIKHLAREVSRVRAAIEQSAETEAAAWSQTHVQDVIAKLKYATDSIRLGLPHVVCVYCGGSDSESCRACKETGFLSKARVRCAPRELRTGKDGGTE